MTNKFKLIAVVATMLLTTMTTSPLQAVPAKPGVISVEQPDGTQLDILMKGDEHFNWSTTTNGYPIVSDNEGYFYYATCNPSGEFSATRQRVSINNRIQTPPKGVSNQSIAPIAAAVGQQRRAAAAENVDTRASASKFPSIGTIRSAVILVEFSDVKFSVDDPYTAFYNQLNQQNYSVGGATGSARDYFHANSRGQFNGQFDVYGPYTLPNNRAYYGADSKYGGIDMRPAEMIKDGVSLASKSGVDFSVYDYDNDDYIDNVFVYYAGHNQAEGGGTDAVWPHKSVVAQMPAFSGKTLYVYACTSELRGNMGANIAGIGTFCHEFSHIFGLADHYDTNGPTYGESFGLGKYDIMTDGAYNNSGNTPPMHNALELEMIGWVEPSVIHSDMDIEIEPINSGKTYKILTEIENEYFLIENRYQGANAWEKRIPASGLIITHIDRSAKYIDRWTTNGPNNHLDHECHKYVVAGGNPIDGKNWDEVPYPFKGNNAWTSSSSPAAKSWSGRDLDYNIVDIKAVGNGNITFKAVSSKDAAVKVLIGNNNSKIYVDEEFTLTSSTYPAQTDSSVTWSSSDESIATISSEGVAKFIAEGEVEFRATLNSDNQYVGSITISATELQGAKGAVTDVDNKPLENATLIFYKASRKIDTVDGVQQVVFTRSTVATDIVKVITHEDGLYKIELEEGYYEVEIDCIGHNELFEVVKIENGANQLDFALDSYANSIDEILVEPGQTTAALYWNPQTYKAFKIVYSKGAAYIDYEVTTDIDSQYVIDGLESGREYTVTVSGRVGTTTVYKKLYTTTFTTLTQTTTMPLMQLENYDDYKAGDLLTLNMLNSDSRDSITWYIDDEKIETNKWHMTSGEHTIKATVVRPAGTFKVIRKISVN